GGRMWSLAWLGRASLCLGAAWAVPAKERRKAEKPKADLALYENLDLDNYDLTLDSYGEILDLSNYEELYDYGDLAPKIEVGTLAPRPKDPETLPDLGATAETPKLQPPSTAGPIHPGPIPVQEGVRVGGTWLYPPAPPAQCAGTLRQLRQMFCSMQNSFLLFCFIQWPNSGGWESPGCEAAALGSFTSSLLPGEGFGPDQLVYQQLLWLGVSGPSLGLGAGRFISPFFPQDLKQLQFLHLSDNQLDFIPAPLPESLRSLHLQNNNIRTMHEDTFCDSQDHSQVRRALEDIRLDGNPINLSLFPDAYFCLPRLPTGRF
ncbi:Opticin, partial [Manacus vitellinus]